MSHKITFNINGPNNSNTLKIEYDCGCYYYFHYDGNSDKRYDTYTNTLCDKHDIAIKTLFESFGVGKEV